MFPSELWESAVDRRTSPSWGAVGNMNGMRSKACCNSISDGVLMPVFGRASIASTSKGGVGVKCAGGGGAIWAMVLRVVTTAELTPGRPAAAEESRAAVRNCCTRRSLFCKLQFWNESQPMAVNSATISSSFATGLALRPRLPTPLLIFSSKPTRAMLVQETLNQPKFTVACEQRP